MNEQPSMVRRRTFASVPMPVLPPLSPDLTLSWLI